MSVFMFKWWGPGKVYPIVTQDEYVRELNERAFQKAIEIFQGSQEREASWQQALDDSATSITG